jgi:hypothetical protein
VALKLRTFILQKTPWREWERPLSKALYPKDIKSHNSIRKKQKAPLENRQIIKTHSLRGKCLEI